MQVTPDGRYFVVRGRLWRTANRALSEAERVRLVAELMAARRQVGVAKRKSDGVEEQQARQAVDRAEQDLDERGPVW